ncbi:hypothetical protein ACHAWU_001665 [Discostella pseudostelligera]|uniref:Uncharacterized protein n=1 Tax=Discostella pseudostelligera TaxID=259834 RepID=A0ABD3MQF2_9STRA
MPSDEISLRRFGRLCRSFYNSSLILRPSSSSLSSSKEEKKSEDSCSCRAIDAKKQYEDGRIVIETLDRIIAIRSLIVSAQHQQSQNNLQTNYYESGNAALQSSIASLRQEHALIVAQHSDTLKECGLADIDRFIDSMSTENDTISHDKDSSILLLQQYTQLRDAVRRRAHQTAMLHRQNSLFDLLSESFTSSVSDNSTTIPRMTEVNNVQHTLTIIRTFVSKYRSNIGSHSFLAGLHRVVAMQSTPTRSSDPYYIVRWKFNGSVLTEACRSNNCGKNNLKDQEDANDDNDLVYAHDAIEVLSSFLIRIDDDIDIESGEIRSIVARMDDDDDGMVLHESTTNDVSIPEPILSFEIDKYISNNNLQRILAILPDPKCLDARATGLVEVVDASSSMNANGMKHNQQQLVPRKNVDGSEDEQWPWFSRLEFCTVL